MDAMSLEIAYFASIGLAVWLLPKLETALERKLHRALPEEPENVYETATRCAQAMESLGFTPGEARQMVETAGLPTIGIGLPPVPPLSKMPQDASAMVQF